MRIRGIELAGRDRDEEVGLVGGQGEEDAAGPFDPGLLQHLVVGRVALDEEERRRGRGLVDPGPVGLDDDEITFRREELVDDGLGRLVGAADDVVALEPADVLFHLAPPQDAFELPLDDERGDRGHGEGDRPQREDDVGRGKDAGGRVRAEVVGFAVADGADGDDGHVDRVEEGPFGPSDHLEAGDADEEDGDEQPEGDVDAFAAVHGVPASFAPIIRKRRRFRKAALSA